MGEIIAFFDRLVTDFTWKRLIFVFFAFTLLICSIAIYESYTHHFKLNRIAHTAEVIEKITNQKDFNLVRHSKMIDEINNELLTELKQKPPVKYLDIESLEIPTWMKKIAAAFAPWLFLIAVILIFDKSNSKNAVPGIMLVAIPASAVSVWIPTFQPAITYIAIPSVIFVVAIALLLLATQTLTARYTNR